MRHLTAGDIMSPKVWTVKADTTVRELATMFAEQQISGAPVLGDDGQVVGVVSVSDVAAFACNSAAVAPDRSNPTFLVRGWEERLNADELRQLRIEDEGLQAQDIMTSAVYSVATSTPVTEVARTMADGHLHRVLVIDDQEVRGIISTLDVLKLVAELD